MATVQEATVRHIGGMAFTGTAGSGHTVWMDGAPEVGGENRGLRPTEMILVGLAGCTGMDVISMLRKMRQEVTDYRVEVHGTKRDEHPRIFTEISVEHIVTGHDLNAEMIEKAVALSSQKYCSVSAMLSHAAKVIHNWRVVEAVEPVTH